MIESKLYFDGNGNVTTWIIITIFCLIPIIILIIQHYIYRYFSVIIIIIILSVAVILFGSGFISILSGFINGIKERESTSSQLQTIQDQLSGLIIDVNKINNTCK